MSADNGECRKCRHYKKHDSYDAGFCRRYPPQLVVVSSRNDHGYVEYAIEQRFPWMEGGEGCGEYGTK